MTGRGVIRPELEVSAGLGTCYSRHVDGNPIPAIPYAKTETASSTMASSQTPVSLGRW